MHGPSWPRRPCAQIRGAQGVPWHVGRRSTAASVVGVLGVGAESFSRRGGCRLACIAEMGFISVPCLQSRPSQALPPDVLRWRGWMIHGKRVASRRTSPPIERSWKSSRRSLPQSLSRLPVGNFDMSGAFPMGKSTGLRTWECRINHVVKAPDRYERTAGRLVGKGLEAPATACSPGAGTVLPERVEHAVSTSKGPRLESPPGIGICEPDHAMDSDPAYRGRTTSAEKSPAGQSDLPYMRSIGMSTLGSRRAVKCRSL